MKRFLALTAFASVAAFGDVLPALDVSSAGITCDSSSGTGIECTYRYSALVQPTTTLRGLGQVAFPQFFTIYDFNGYVPGSARVDASLAGIFSVSPTTLTPSTINEALINTPGIPDITFVYIGSENVATNTLFTGFSARSIYGPGTELSDYSSVSTLALGNSEAQSTSKVLVPQFGAMPSGDPAAVPEPMTMGLLGSGLGALILFKRFRKN